jgi:hypothetical protein
MKYTKGLRDWIIRICTVAMLAKTNWTAPWLQALSGRDTEASSAERDGNYL